MQFTCFIVESINKHDESLEREGWIYEGMYVCMDGWRREGGGRESESALAVGATSCLACTPGTYIGLTGSLPTDHPTCCLYLGQLF